MPLLDDTVLNDRYETIVIGSGLSSLTAAALLAKRGRQVLLVEYHYLPGGMCTTLRRQGFSFDTGTALMYGFGPKGFNSHHWLMNELGEDVDIIAHQSLLRMHFEGKTITFWPDYDWFLDELTTAFPTQEKELRALYGYLRDIYTKVIARDPVIVPPTETPPRDNLKILLHHPGAMLTTLRMLSTNTESALKRFIQDPDLLAFFDKLTSTYCYCTVRETPAILAATMFVDNHVGGAYYPARSPQILASTLERAIERHGGQTLYRRAVEEIIIEKGRATGVRLSDGTALRADRIIAGVTVWNLYGKLIRPEHSRLQRRRWAEGLIPTYGAMVLYLGVAAEAIPAGTHPVEMLVADKQGVNSGDVTVYISSLDDPSICPPGMHAMTIIAPSMMKWPAPGEPAYRAPEYREQKRVQTERILDQLEGHFPNLRRHIRVMDVGTPATIERYTLKNRGAVGGPKQCIGQEMMKRLHGRSEWKNLYLCGDSTVMGMGTPAVTVSGVGAANLVLRDLGLPEYHAHPFERESVHMVKGRPLAPLPQPGEPLDAARAQRLARECQYCEKPGCRAACPAGIDMGNVLRRIEAGNFIGAARSVRETNPFGEVCGRLCRPNPPCERNCNRREFASEPVRIADLQDWVCREAGEEGWSRQFGESRPGPVAVIGAGPAGLTCAYFLARLGYSVDVFDNNRVPGGGLVSAGRADADLKEAAAREVRNLLTSNVAFHGASMLGSGLLMADVIRGHSAVFLATGEDSRAVVAREIGVDQVVLTPKDLIVAGQSNIWAGGSLVRGQCSTVQAAADGRRAAVLIARSLQSRQ